MGFKVGDNGTEGNGLFLITEQALESACLFIANQYDPHLPLTQIKISRVAHLSFQGEDGVLKSQRDAREMCLQPHQGTADQRNLLLNRFVKKELVDGISSLSFNCVQRVSFVFCLFFTSSPFGIKDARPPKYEVSYSWCPEQGDFVMDENPRARDLQEKQTGDGGAVSSDSSEGTSSCTEAIE